MIRELPPDERRRYPIWLVSSSPLPKREPDPEVIAVLRRIEAARIREYFERRKRAS